MITEARLKLFCDHAQVKQAIDFIRMHSRTGQSESGWVYVSDVATTYNIDNPEENTP